MMRIQQLHLALFGHFVGKTFDFGAKPEKGPDLHIIYGLNEAGKTTTMEAYVRLLYGFPHREPYDFQHQRKNLRISGLLNIDGVEKYVTRLPSRHASLLDQSGTPLPENAIQAQLSGLALEDYRHLFCLDDDTIEQGGEEIANSKGDIGRLLFSAAAGISNLSGLLEQVQNDADDYYRKRASTTAFAKLKKALTETEQRIKDVDIPASVYRKRKQAWQAACEEERAAREERQRLESEQSRLQAQCQALPILAEIAQIHEEIAPYAHYPKHLDIHPERLVQMLSEQSKAQGEAERLQASMATLKNDIDQIQRPEADLLTLNKALQTLDALRSRYATADLDLERRRQSLKDLLADMANVAQSLGYTDAKPTALVITEGELQELEQALGTLRETTHQVYTTEQAIAELQSDIAQQQHLARYAATENPLDHHHHQHSGGKIADIFSVFAVDTLSAKYAAARQAIQDAEQQYQEALDALMVKGQAFDTVPICPLTAAEAAEFAEQYQEGTRKIAKAEEDIHTLQADIDAQSAKITQLKASGGLISDQDAETLQNQRDSLWQTHRQTLTSVTAERFADAMQQVDQAAQTRLSQAKDLGQLRQLALALGETRSRLQHAQAALDTLKAAQQRIHAVLSDAIQQSGVQATLTATACAHWIQQQHSATQALQSWQRVQARHTAVLDSATQLETALKPYIRQSSPDFDDLIAAARRLETAERKHHEKVNHIQQSLANFTAAKQKRTAALAQQQAQASVQLVQHSAHNRQKRPRI